ncbi:uncharacterized protein BYT42DRAFT_559011 [Radiomyces spectabilis]|uniref:uncharacterized protein n=1 Tax=Radiomyces spectabilis TaxID=64574 RepID=UPI00221ED886|nr:uncharacterized protein BYT42DRAFT_559011 [Radiomyces spectabilis]KAI8388120.1 hypothetical protein BYT42DRAFT_559011 [Radiomyces spectabilis]
MLEHLPSEITWHILSFLHVRDLASLRLICKRLQVLCDYPAHWRHVTLIPEVSGSLSSKLSPCHSPSLWQLSELRSIIAPHRMHIRSIHIWGVRDTIVRYLLEQCPLLEKLSLCSWTTLSDHAFKLPLPRRLRLRHLELISRSATSYVAMDSNCLGRLFTMCPDLQKLVLTCPSHIRAQTLVKQFKRHRPSELMILTMIVQREWPENLESDILAACPGLKQLCLQQCMLPAPVSDVLPKLTLESH